MFFNVGSLVLQAVFCLPPISSLRATQPVEVKSNTAPPPVRVRLRLGQMLQGLPNRHGTRVVVRPKLHSNGEVRTHMRLPTRVFYDRLRLRSVLRLLFRRNGSPGSAAMRLRRMLRHSRLTDPLRGILTGGPNMGYPDPGAGGATLSATLGFRRRRLPPT